MFFYQQEHSGYTQQNATCFGSWTFGFPNRCSAYAHYLSTELVLFVVDLYIKESLVEFST